MGGQPGPPARRPADDAGARRLVRLEHSLPWFRPCTPTDYGFMVRDQTETTVMSKAQQLDRTDPSDRPTTR